MGSAASGWPASKCVAAVEARGPPADKPQVPMRFGSRPYSLARQPGRGRGSRRAASIAWGDSGGSAIPFGAGWRYNTEVCRSTATEPGATWYRPGYGRAGGVSWLISWPRKKLITLLTAEPQFA